MHSNHAAHLDVREISRKQVDVLLRLEGEVLLHAQTGLSAYFLIFSMVRVQL